MDTLRLPPIKIKFSDDTVRQVLARDPNSNKINDTVQILRVGEFIHPDSTIGKVIVTSEMLSQMVTNFQNNVRGIDIAIDYKHESDDIAAGWVREVFLSEDGMELWARVDWTPAALKKLADKEFRYLSADFHMNYKHNETLQEYGPTLFGAGLTNRPVVKNMRPAVELQEAKKELKPKGEKMPEEKPEDKKPEMMPEDKDQFMYAGKKLDELSGDEIKYAMKKLEDKLKSLEGEKKEMSEEKKEEVVVEAEKEVEAPKAAAPVEEVKEDVKLSEKKSTFDNLVKAGRAVEAQRDAFMTDDMVKFAELAQPINLSESGSDAVKKEEQINADPQDAVLALARKKLSEANGKLTLDAAISMVLSENNDLHKKYREAVEV